MGSFVFVFSEAVYTGDVYANCSSAAVMLCQNGGTGSPASLRSTQSGKAEYAYVMANRGPVLPREPAAANRRLSKAGCRRVGGPQLAADRARCVRTSLRSTAKRSKNRAANAAHGRSTTFAPRLSGFAVAVRLTPVDSHGLPQQPLTSTHSAAALTALKLR